MKEAKKNRRKVIGVIVPSGWTDEGRVTGIALFSTDEKEYLIELKCKGKELMRQINAQVEIEGDITHQVDGPATIRIAHYRLIDLNRL